jgi:hypothetical protein
MYKIRDISRSYGLSDETYESLEDANRAAIFRSAQTGSDVQVIYCPDLEDMQMKAAISGYFAEYFQESE